jgi:hypothetical protein
MGFWGVFVVARGTENLADDPSIRAAGQVSWSAVDGDWQAVQINDCEAAPVPPGDWPGLTALVLDSDVALVDAAGGPTWRAALNREAAEDYAPAELLAQDPEDVTGAAVAWATAHGLRPDRGAVLAALTTDEDFAEEAWFALLEALGLRFGTDAVPG